MRTETLRLGRIYSNLTRNKEIRSSISNAISYEEIGEFWDEHDTADYWNQTCPVDFTIKLKDDEDVIYYGIDES